MNDCVFCKIVQGEIPSAKVYEDDDAMAFLDIHPVKKGHTLVIPKKHFETIMVIPDELLKKVIAIVKKLTPAVIKAVNADGAVVTQTNNEAAGQSVPHLHFHIIPRYRNDGLKFWPQGKHEEGEIRQFQEKIKKALTY